MLGIEEVFVVEEENPKRISVSRFGGAGLPNCFGLGRWFIIQCGVLIVLQVQKLCVVASLELFPSFKNPSILIGIDGKVIIKFHGTKLLFYYFNCILGNLGLHEGDLPQLGLLFS